MMIEKENTEMMKATPKRVALMMNVSERTASRYILIAKEAMNLKKPKILTIKNFKDYFF